MKCQVSVIQKRDRGVIWITIKIKKIIVVIYFTQTDRTNKEKQINTQQKKEKKSSLC